MRLACGEPSDAVGQSLASELANGLEDQLGQFVQRWLSEAWPFEAIVLNGQPLSLRSSKPG